MAKVSQRFWSLFVLAAALLTLGEGCGRNDLPSYGGLGLGGESGSPAAGFGNRAGARNAGGFRQRWRLPQRRCGFGNSSGANNGATGGVSPAFCGDGFCGPGESMDTCIKDCHPLCHDGVCNLQVRPAGLPGRLRDLRQQLSATTVQTNSTAAASSALAATVNATRR